MGWFSEDIVTMEDLFQHTLEDIYYAENQIQKALPDMVEKATDPELKRGFRKHLAETRGHIKRLEQVFKKLKQEPKGTKCPAIDGIIDEANEIAGEVEDKMVLNAALIGAAQAVEHYEMTRYGTLVAWARVIGRPDVAKLLEANLKQERRPTRSSLSSRRRKSTARRWCAATSRKRRWKGGWKSRRRRWPPGFRPSDTAPGACARPLPFAGGARNISLNDIFRRRPWLPSRRSITRRCASIASGS